VCVCVCSTLFKAESLVYNVRLSHSSHTLSLSLSLSQSPPFLFVRSSLIYTHTYTLTHTLSLFLIVYRILLLLNGRSLCLYLVSLEEVKRSFWFARVYVCVCVAIITAVAVRSRLLKGSLR
jgi:hypothetical protein